MDEKELDKIPDWISKKEQETKEKNVVLKDGKKIKLKTNIDYQYIKMFEKNYQNI